MAAWGRSCNAADAPLGQYFASKVYSTFTGQRTLVRARFKILGEITVLLLILTICSISTPGNCSEARLQFSAEESMMQCMMQAQPYIAQWSEEHPDARVTRWRCSYPEREASKI